MRQSLAVEDESLTLRERVVDVKVLGGDAVGGWGDGRDEEGISSAQGKVDGEGTYRSASRLS